MKKKKIGQITIKKIGNKFAACISGTPQELKNTFEAAEKVVEKLRSKHGRRHYEYPNKKRKPRRRSRK